MEPRFLNFATANGYAGAVGFIVPYYLRAMGTKAALNFRCSGPGGLPALAWTFCVALVVTSALAFAQEAAPAGEKRRSPNRRNGRSKKTVQGDLGEVTLALAVDCG